MSEFISKVKRTHSCGALRASDIGSEVVLFGWVQNRRDHGGLIFIDLRDREGLTQIVFDPSVSKEAHALAESFRSEWVIGMRGKVRSRGMQWSKKENKEIPATNPNLATGEIEVYVSYAEIFNKAETPPFEISEHVNTAEERRLEHRYLDLRRPNLQKTLITRSKMNAATRAYFHENGFLELETPFMGRYTPGGARNFLVPSRLNPGKFYALAESPQLYKQLFMVAGFDRYFQIVKCFRDEDLRLDRQPEFTQIDVEMSFVKQDDIFEIIEGLLKKMWKTVHGIDIPTPFRRMDFDESMSKYGNDKPDLRFGMEHVVLNDVLKKFGEAGGVAPMLEVANQKGGLVKAMVVRPVKAGEHNPHVVADKEAAFRRANPNPTAKMPPAPTELSRKEIEETEAYVVGMGAKGLARSKIAENGDWAPAPLFKTASPELKQAILEATGAKPGDLILFQFGPEAKVHTIMANLRVYLAKKLWLIPEYGSGGQWNFLWVVNPPLFEYDDESKTWAAAHHAFTRPMDECLQYLDEATFDPGKVYCYRYDVVLNGFEIGGGSIRLHDPAVQAKVFKAMGISDEDARSKFGFLLDALKFGAPPHGGIALGMDRLAFLITETESLRDVIPFPKTQKGTDLMTLAPGDVDEKQLRDLYVKSVPPAK